MPRSLNVVLLLLTACPGQEMSTSSNPDASTSSSSGGGDTSTGVPTSTSGEPTSTGPSTGPGPSSDATTSTTSSESNGDTSETTPTSSSTTTSGSESSESSDSSDGGGPGCVDGMQNQDETDVDCGGAVCDPCELGDACTADLDCKSGWCDALQCATPGCLLDSDCEGLSGPCKIASCDLTFKTCTVLAVEDGETCEDGDLCTKGEKCDQGACEGATATNCSGLDNSCGVGSCDPQTGDCVADPLPGSEGKPCDDGFVCTPDDTCQAGLCGEGGPGYLFFEDFNTPQMGWEMGPLWQMGPAAASPEGSTGADPADDHSPGNDDRLAGTVIGGLVPQAVQAKTCLTSPTIDAGDGDELWLSFWRHLHTDHFPFVAHTIEVFDGSAWEVVETGYANPGVNDPAWTQVSYDLGPYADPALRVRICYAQIEGALVHAGWSLDDLTVGPHVCTPEP